jgi:hypothetical protein
MALRQFILLKPEPDAVDTPQQRAEAAEAEAEHPRQPPPA